MFKTCIKCGKIIPANMGSRCADHPNRWRSGSTREWRKTRERILARDGYRCTVHVRPGNAASGPSCSRFTTLTTAMRTCCSFPTPSSPPSAASTTRAEARSKTRGSSYPRRKGGPSPRARQACESAQGYTNERRGPRRCAGICTQADSRSAGPTGCGAVRLRTWRESTPEGDSVSPNRLRGGRAKGRRAWLTPQVSVSLPDW